MGRKKLLSYHIYPAVVWLMGLALVIGGIPTRSQAQSESVIALVGGTLIDGNGGKPLQDSVVLITGNLITKVFRQKDMAKIKLPERMKHIDVTGKYIVPGLIDMHVHYFDWMGELFLAHGVTTVKDLGNDPEWIMKMQTDIAQGRVRGPRIFYVGNGLDTPPPSRDTHVAVGTPQMAKRAVALLAEKGASAIKVREKLTPEILKAIVEEAHRLHIPVTGHIASINAREAADAGIDGLEHNSGVMEATAAQPPRYEPGQNELQRFILELKAFSTIDMAKGEALMKYLAKKKVALIPTLSNRWRMTLERRDEYAREDTAYAQNALLKYAPEQARGLWATSAIYKIKNPDDLATAEAGYKKVKTLLTQYYKAGGKLLTGSDTFFSVPGLTLQREIVAFVDLGMTPMQAIQSATRDSAEFLGKGRELGTITPGKLADLFVVNANPLDDIRNLQRVALVVKNGQLVDTTYHADYSVPNPRPATFPRPNWLERQLQPSGNSGGQMMEKKAELHHTLEQEVLQVDDERAEAFVQGDTAVLDRIVADDCVYVHSNGRIETKAQLITGFKAGDRKYESIQRDDMNVQVYGSTGVVTGRNTIKAKYQGQDFTVQNRFTRIYVKQQGHWRLIAHQATSIAQP